MEQALIKLKLALKIYKFYFDENNFYMANPFRFLGIIYLEFDDFNEAERLLKKA